MRVQLRKTKSISFTEFMNGECRNKKKRISLKTAASTVIPPLAIVGHANVSYAQEAVPVVGISDTIKENILTAFDPLIDLMISLSYPIAGVMITGASLMIMIGQKDKGYSLIQTAGIGYILVQLSPLFLKLLVGVGEAV